MGIIGTLLIIGISIVGFCLLSIIVLFTIGLCKDIIEDTGIDELFKKKPKNKLK